MVIGLQGNQPLKIIGNTWANLPQRWCGNSFTFVQLQKVMHEKNHTWMIMKIIHAAFLSLSFPFFYDLIFGEIREERKTESTHSLFGCFYCCLSLSLFFFIHWSVEKWHMIEERKTKSHECHTWRCIGDGNGLFISGTVFFTFFKEI